MTINLLDLYEDIQAMRSYTILKITTLNSDYEGEMGRRDACLRCSGGMPPPSTIPSSIQSTVQSYQIMHQRAPVTIPNRIPNQILIQSATMPILHLMKPYEISRQRCNNFQSEG